MPPGNLTWLIPGSPRRFPRAWPVSAALCLAHSGGHGTRAGSVLWLLPTRPPPQLLPLARQAAVCSPCRKCQGLRVQGPPAEVSTANPFPNAAPTQPPGPAQQRALQQEAWLVCRLCLRFESRIPAP